MGHSYFSIQKLWVESVIPIISSGQFLKTLIYCVRRPVKLSGSPTSKVMGIKPDFWKIVEVVMICVGLSITEEELIP